MSIKITIPNSSSDVLTFGSGNTPTAAQIAGIDSGSSNGQLALYTTASGTSTERVRVDSSGNVGIGTSSPSERLDVFGIIRSRVASGSVARLYLNNTDTQLSVENSGGNMLFTRAGAAESMRIDSSGKLCVGRTSGSGTLNVQGDLYLYSPNSGAGNAPLKYNTATAQVTYDASSRLVKDNIIDSIYGLAEVMQLKSRKYFRTDDQREEIGFIADEVQEILPEFVSTVQKSIFTKNVEDTEIVAGGVSYDKLTSVLVKAIQEQQAIIQTLTDRITALEGATS